MDEEDAAVLSKLTGVSRSVSWGRSSAPLRGESSASTPGHGGASSPHAPRHAHHDRARSTPSNTYPSRWSVQSIGSLSMSTTPREESGSPGSMQSSPASAAAFSLRSISGGERSASGEYPSAAGEHHGLVGSDNLEGLGVRLGEVALRSETPGGDPERPPRETVPISLEEPYGAARHHRREQAIDANASATADIPKIDVQGSPAGAGPRSISPPGGGVWPASSAPPWISPTLPPTELRHMRSWRSLHDEPSQSSSELLGAEGSLDTPEQQRARGEPVGTGVPAGIARRHAGLFQSQASEDHLARSVPGYAELRSETTSPTNDGGSTRARLTRFFSRMFRESLPGTGATSPDAGSVPASASVSPPPGIPPRTLVKHARSTTPTLATTAFHHLTPAQLLPRPQPSPMGASFLRTPEASSSEDEEEHEERERRAGAAAPAPSPARTPSPSPLVSGERRHTLSDYEVADEVGKGAYGFVRRARRRGTREYSCLIKYIVKHSIFADSWRQHRVHGVIPAEIFVLIQLQNAPYTPPSEAPAYLLDKAHWPVVRDQILADQRAGRVTGHPYICKVLDFFEDDEYYYLVMPCFGDGHDLFDYVESSPFGLHPSEVRNFLGQLAEALSFMHANGVVHRDVKDENVILDAHGFSQLIDFGSAARLRPGRQFDTFNGTIDYTAAEILRGEKYTGPPQDVWAFGVVAFVLVCGECPFRDSQEAERGLAPDSRSMQLLRHFCVVQPRCEGAADDGGARLPDAMDLIARCLDLDPEARPPAAELTQHSFLAGRTGWTGPGAWRTREPGKAA